MKRVTGIGGVFFKTDDPKKLKDWYKNHLGFNTDDYGAVFKWIDADTNKTARTVWSPFKNDTTYFHPSEKSFMFSGQ